MTWWWRQYAPLKHRYTWTRLHGAIFHKAIIFLAIMFPNVFLISWPSPPPFSFPFHCDQRNVNVIIPEHDTWHTWQCLCKMILYILFVLTRAYGNRQNHTADGVSVYIWSRDLPIRGGNINHSTIMLQYGCKVVTLVSYPNNVTPVLRDGVTCR
jgi:hypothetical protein